MNEETYHQTLQDIANKGHELFDLINAAMDAVHETAGNREWDHLHLMMQAAGMVTSLVHEHNFPRASALRDDPEPDPTEATKVVTDDEQASAAQNMTWRARAEQLWGEAAPVVIAGIEQGTRAREAGPHA